MALPKPKSSGTTVGNKALKVAGKIANSLVVQPTKAVGRMVLNAAAQEGAEFGLLFDAISGLTRGIGGLGKGMFGKKKKDSPISSNAPSTNSGDQSGKLILSAINRQGSILMAIKNEVSASNGTDTLKAILTEIRTLTSITSRVWGISKKQLSDSRSYHKKLLDAQRKSRFEKQVAGTDNETLKELFGTFGRKQTTTGNGSTVSPSAAAGGALLSSLGLPPEVSGGLVGGAIGAIGNAALSLGKKAIGAGLSGISNAAKFVAGGSPMGLATRLPALGVLAKMGYDMSSNVGQTISDQKSNISNVIDSTSSVYKDKGLWAATKSLFSNNKTGEVAGTVGKSAIVSLAQSSRDMIGGLADKIYGEGFWKKGTEALSNAIESGFEKFFMRGVKTPEQQKMIMQLQAAGAQQANSIMTNQKIVEQVGIPTVSAGGANTVVNAPSSTTNNTTIVAPPGKQEEWQARGFTSSP